MEPIITGKLTTFGSMHPRDRYTSVAVIGREYLVLNNRHRSAVIMVKGVGNLTRYFLIKLLRELPRTTKTVTVGPHTGYMGDIDIKYDTRSEIDGVTISVGDVSVFITRQDAAVLADLID